MKCKEYKEMVTKNMKSIRRSGDLETLCRHSELLSGLARGGINRKDIEIASIIAKLFRDDVTEKQLHTINVFASAFLRS